MAQTVHAGAGGWEPFPWPVPGSFLEEEVLNEEEHCKAGAWLRELAARSAEPSLNAQLGSRGQAGRGGASVPLPPVSLSLLRCCAEVTPRLTRNLPEV